MALPILPQSQRILGARPDPLDFRDRLYVAQLNEVPTKIPLSDYRSYRVPVLNQEHDETCTGFGLATVANYLLARRKVIPDLTPVSPRMFYELAQRYDEWPGENYSGSSARGAMKAWHKHGICSEEAWPYLQAKDGKHGLTDARTKDAVGRPLGAYFRVNHKDLVAMHSALAEVGVLYATALVHDGWDPVGPDGVIPYSDLVLGGHAFAIVAYDDQGFWLQNSWGSAWGRDGFGCITYDDWLANGTDVWVARLGAAIKLREPASAAHAHSASAGESAAYSYADLRPHIVSLGDNGQLRPDGNYGTSPDELRQIFEDDIPTVTANWPTRRILLYAHGGLVGEETAVQRVADYRSVLLQNHIYPIAFIWHTDYWTTLTNIIQDAVRRRRPEGALERVLDVVLDRIDDALEPVVRDLTGKLIWDKIKQNATAASQTGGGARQALGHLANLRQRDRGIEVHVLGHSAGAVFLAPIVELLTTQGRVPSGPLQGEPGYGMPIASCTLWAPGCTLERFKEAYLPSIANNSIDRFSLVVLNDKFEQDDNCAGIYHKSLLYLVSNALEEFPHIPFFRDGVPLLGMEKYIDQDEKVKAVFGQESNKLVIAPNHEPEGSPTASGCQHHGDFDHDGPTVAAALATILDQKQAAAGPATPSMAFQRSGSSLRDRRLQIDAATRVAPKA